MANTLYNTARKQFLEAQINWDTNDIRCMLVDTSEYTFNAADVTIAEITPAARIGSPVNMVTSTTDDGAADANDVTFSSVTAGDQVGAIAIYKSYGATEADTVLIAWLDTATGLPITTNGGDIIVTWDNGINRIFRL